MWARERTFSHTVCDLNTHQPAEVSYRPFSAMTVLRNTVSHVLSMRAMLQGKDDKGKGKGKGKDTAQAGRETQKARAPLTKNPYVRAPSFRVLDACTGYLKAQERDLPAKLVQVPPGTVASEGIAQPSHLNFFLVSQLGRAPSTVVGGNVARKLCLHPRVERKKPFQVRLRV